MSLPRWWQAWKRPAAAASAAVALSGLLATATWAQSPTATERDTTDREDRQQRAGDDERRDQRSDSQSQRVRDEGEQRVDQERRAGEQASQQQRRMQQNNQQSQQQSRQSQQRSSSRDDRDDQDRDRDRNQQQGQSSQGQHSQSGQYTQGQRNQAQYGQGQNNQNRYGQGQSQQRQQYGQSQQGQRRDYSYDRSSQHNDQDRDRQSQYGLTWSQRNDGRLVVNRVESDSAWDRIGLADGDRIVSINGNRIRSVQDFNRYYAAVQPGQRARIVVYRDGDEESLYWTPRQNAQAQHSQSQQHGHAFLGVQLDDRYEDSAVVKAVYQGSPAERAGLKAGDTIVSLNGQEVSSPHDLTDIVGDMQPGEQVHLQIARRQNLNTQVQLGSRSSDDVRQASFQDRERRSYSNDQSSGDDDDQNSRRRDNQRDNDDDRNDRNQDDDDSNQSDD